MSLKINETKKLFFNKFVYKLNLELGGICYLKRMSLSSIEKLEHFGTTYGYGRHTGQRDHAVKNKHKILALGFFLEDCAQTHKFQSRAEGSTLGLYTNDINFINKVKSEWAEIVSEVWQPSSSEAETFLRSNTRKIICNELPKGRYRYKVHLAQRQIPTNIRVGFLNWASKYGDERLHLPYTTKKNLGEEGSGYFYGQYFYTSDDKILNMSLMFFSDYIQKTEHYVLKTELS